MYCYIYTLKLLRLQYENSELVYVHFRFQIVILTTIYILSKSKIQIPTLQLNHFNLDQLLLLVYIFRIVNEEDHFKITAC